MKFLFILALCVYLIVHAVSSIPFETEPLTDEIIDEINRSVYIWKAGKNFNGSSSIQMDTLFATQNETFDQDFDSKEVLIPVSFDARKAWPNCTSIGKIYDQKKGYPSWIYVSVGTIADHLCIKTGLQIDVETTVEQLMKSSLGFEKARNSANIGQAFKYWSKYGIFTVESEKDSSRLPDPIESKPKRVKIHRHFKISAQNIITTLGYKNEIMNNGPVASYIEIYTDFPSYKSGIYIRDSRRALGFHNMKLIGWGQESYTNYFLATNSWGTDWGEKGLFKIESGSGQFGYVPRSIVVSIVPTEFDPDNLSFSEEQLFYLA